MKKGMNWRIYFFITTFCFLTTKAIAADVDVYAEGAYTNTDLVVYLYADINGSNLVSNGVKVTYNTAELTSPIAEKNVAVWFMGDGVTNYPYAAPDVSTPGEVIIIGGKLNTNAPTEGVPAVGEPSTRVLLGKVTFARVNSTLPVADPAATFQVGLGLGKTGNYVNFATNDNPSVALDNETDGVAFTGVTVRQRGDANGNGVINTQDMGAIRFFMTNGGNQYPWMDCNGNGTINTQDMGCIRFIMTN